MAENKKTDAGKSGLEYYQTLLEPADWWQWFQADYSSQQGWTEVDIYHHKYYIRVRPDYLI